MSKTYTMNQDKAFETIVDNNALLFTMLENQVDILDQLNPDISRDEIYDDINKKLQANKDRILESLESGNVPIK